MNAILLSEAILFARHAGVDVCSASDAELLANWRRCHPHHAQITHLRLPRMRPARGARIIALGWRDAKDGSLHVRILRDAASGPPRRVLASALCELVLWLMGKAWRCPTQAPEDAPLQCVAFDASDGYGPHAVFVEQLPWPRYLGSRPWLYRDRERQVSA